MAVASSGAPRARRFRPRLGDEGRGLGLLLNAPALFVIFMVIGLPIMYAIWISLHDWRLIRPDSFEFVGIGNYLKAFASSEFQGALRFTLVYSAVVVPLVIAAGIGIALLINELFRGRGFLRMIVFIPWAVPDVMSGAMWHLLYDGHYGLLNGLLLSLGVIDTYQNWLLEPSTVFPAVVFSSVWHKVPEAAIIALAALQAIPGELYDSARVDRAGIWQRFRHITFPWLEHAILLLLIMQTISALRTYDIIYVLTAGGPGSSTTTLAWLAQQTSFRSLDFGLGAAFSLAIAIFTFFLATFYFRLLYARGVIKV